MTQALLTMARARAYYGYTYYDHTYYGYTYYDHTYYGYTYYVHTYYGSRFS